MELPATHIATWLSVGKLPKGDQYITRVVRQLKRNLLGEIAAKYGIINVTHAAAVQSACRHETYSMLAIRWLTKHDKELGPKDRLTFLEAASKATELRDRAIGRLGLDRKERAKVFSTIFDATPPVVTPAGRKRGRKPGFKAKESTVHNSEAVNGAVNTPEVNVTEVFNDSLNLAIGDPPDTLPTDTPTEAGQ